MGRGHRDLTAESGNILVATMIIMLVMSLMGVGLVQSSVKSVNTADYKTIDGEVFHLAESSTQEALTLLSKVTRPPDTNSTTNLPTTLKVPYTFTRTNVNITYLNTGNESQTTLNRLKDYNYTYTITNIANRSVSGDTTGSGTDIGMAGGYGAAGDISPRYYYQIETTGENKAPASATAKSTKKLTVIVSLEF